MQEDEEEEGEEEEEEEEEGKKMPRIKDTCKPMDRKSSKKR